MSEEQHGDAPGNEGETNTSSQISGDAAASPQADPFPELAAPQGFVRGGGAVLTGPYEKQMQAEWADAERRRAEADAQKEVSKIPIEKGGAREREILLAPNEERLLPEGHVLLEHVTIRREPIYVRGKPVRAIGDVKLTDQQAWPGELMLCMFCPRCVQRGLLPVDHCLVQVRQSNRRWYLDPRTRGESFIWEGEDGEIEVYKSIGQICESERITCPACGWSCHIDRNQVINAT